jgi:hypothetical protein
VKEGIELGNDDHKFEICDNLKLDEPFLEAHVLGTQC